KRIFKNEKNRPQNFSFEITESVFSEDYAVLNKELKSFREDGIKIYLDDFGTGYSSLEFLINQSL
ncbi:MAG: EAL domain-containing protein, partial [Sedimentibacter sp.]